MRAHLVGRGLLLASVAVLAGGAVSYAVRHRRPRVAVVPVEFPEIQRGATPDEVLDAAVEYTFPASDPIAIGESYAAALRRLR
jgi:hypothetical protein